MEKDYNKYDKKTKDLLDELGIEYVWRDSCVNYLVETKKCMKNDFTAGLPLLNYLSICKGVQDLWKECQKDREIQLLDQYFVKYRNFGEENDISPK